MKRKIFLAGLLLLFVTPVLNCSRVPSATSAHHLVKKHFDRYGKKYTLTDFGKFAVDKVEIIEIRELQKGIAEIMAFVILDENGGVYKVRATVIKKVIWKIESWENLGSS